MEERTIDPQCLFAATNYPTPTSEHAISPLAEQSPENPFEFWIAPGYDACTSSIWYRRQLGTGFDGLPTWGRATDCEQSGARGMKVAAGSSPCTVIFKGRIYLFYQGLGKTGTFYTVYDHELCRWSEVHSVSTQAVQVVSWCSSPSAVVFEGRVYLFWSGPIKGRKSCSSGIWYSTFDGERWTPSEYCAESGAHGIEVACYTSPTAHSNSDGLFLFFTGNDYDIHYTKSAAILDHVLYWEHVTRVGQHLPGGLSVFRHTSPSVVVGQNSDKTTWQSEFLLMWTADGSAGHNGVQYALYADDKWSPPRELATDLVRAGRSISNVNAVASLLAKMSKLFWNSEQKNEASLDRVDRLSKSASFNHEAFHWPASHRL